MHPKIQELVEKAGMFGMCRRTDGLYILQESVFEKFANLIVQEFGCKATSNPWINQYPGEVFVVFDPMTDGSRILGATRTYEEALQIFDTVDGNGPKTFEIIFKVYLTSDDDTFSNEEFVYIEANSIDEAEVNLHAQLMRNGLYCDIISVKETLRK